MAVELGKPVDLNEYSHLKAAGKLFHIHHGDEGLNAWNDLYRVLDQKVKCGMGCPNQAMFLFYSHDHENKEAVAVVCEQHAPSTYFDY